jgi:tetratricopeptide (TPR) repeat protein
MRNLISLTSAWNQTRLWIAGLICFFVVNSALAVFGQQRQTLSPEDAKLWREDLRFLADELPKRHKNLFHRMSREQFETAVKRLDERIPTLQRHQIIIELGRIFAMVGDGHTLLNLLSSKGGLRRYPLRLYWFKDGIFVQAATSEYAQLAGARVVMIGRSTAEDAYKTIGQVVQYENEIKSRDDIPERMVVPEILHTLDVIDDMEKARFIVERQGKQIAVELSPMEKGKEYSWIEMRSGSSNPTPLWLKDPQNAYWFEYLPEARTVYVQYNSVRQKREESFPDFVKRVFDLVDANPVEKLVLDIRQNGGGDYNFTLPLTHAIIRCQKINQRGKLFTIIGRNTFSAALLFAIDLERHTETIFVGEPTGAKPNNYSENGPFELPNSGLTASVSTHYFQPAFPWDARQWIAPHYAAELASEDYRNNQDPALNFILDYKSKPWTIDIKTPFADELTEVLDKRGFEAAKKLYHDMKTNPLYTYADLYWTLRLTGRRMQNRQRYDEAIKIFELNISEHPRSDEAQVLLGDVYWISQRKEQAIKYYERAAELNPSNWRIADLLRNWRRSLKQPSEK